MSEETEPITVRCRTCSGTLEVPEERARDGPFKHEDCPPPKGGRAYTMSEETRVVIPEYITTETTDRRGRFTLGKAYANQEVKVAVIRSGTGGGESK